ncbi:hypothetical protein IEO21_01589 [Rhodonia placenta]|uniref:UFSP1/2/DUB catalytic domain-containing protein n=1 Tax=Rhodonia placenta TaxID=104341 RepID=A0A8H7P9I2_9APHY|nr:hypothetical protein IEO21_01589 [Postia placenta]
MMTCASLMSQATQPTYFPLLDRPTPPGVRNLQSSIEEAWKHGYDPEGEEQLKHRLVGTGKYIGTGDLYAAFTYRGIPAQLVDFDLLCEWSSGVQPLLDWVLRHFSAGYSSPRTLNEALQSTNSVAITGKMPLILQHNGHSRTIVGCERCVDGTINLLVFDPAKSVFHSHCLSACADWKVTCCLMSHRSIPIEIRNAGLVHHASSRARDNTQQHQEYHVSSPKFLHEVQHPVQAIKAHKRKADETSRTDTSKRPRASIDEGNGKPKGHSDRNSGGQERSKPFEPDPFKVLNIVRLGANKLKYVHIHQYLTRH